jgi:hypothetical protein
VNAVRAKNSELTLIIATEVNQPAATFSGTGQGDLVERPNSGTIFVLQQNNGLACHGRGQAKTGELDQLSGSRLRRGKLGLRLRIHTLIEADRMYLLK